MQEALFPRRDDHRRGGFTLIEVVIALAIFLFGALAIVRIFPPALGIIQNSGDQLTAINLNRSTLAKFEQSPGLVPDATYDATPNFAGAVVGTALRNSSLPRANIQDFDNTALGNFKSISRETHAVAGTTAPYVITQFPYERTQQVLVYTEDSVDGVTMATDGSLDFTDATLRFDGSVFKDAGGNYPPITTPSPNRYGNSGATPPVTDDTVFYVSYSWVEDGNIQAVVDEPIVYNSTTPTATKTVVGNRATTTIIPVVGPVQLRFRRLKYRAAFTPPPTDTTNPNFGDEYRGFVDLSTTASPAPNAFTPGEVVTLDYLVKDWRWLVVDQSPSVKPENVTIENYRLINSPVRLLDKDQAVYTLLAGSSGALLKARQQNGLPIGSGLVPQSFGNADSTPINYKSGQILFDLGTENSARARSTFQALDNWTNQLSVAARSYKPLYSLGTVPIRSNPSEPWRDYINPSDPTTGRSPFLYFRPSEAGKSISISYIYEEPVAGTPTRFEVKNRVFQIKTAIVSASNLNQEVALPPAPSLERFVSELQLTNNSGDPLANNQIKSIQAVRGASIQARTAWLDGNRFTQVSSVGFREVNN